MFQVINTFNPVNRRGELAEMSGCHRVTEASASSGSDHIWGWRSGLSLLQITKFAGITSERPPEGMSHPEMAFFFLHPPPSLLIPCNLLCSARRRHSASGFRCSALCWPIRKGRSIIKHCFYAKTVAVLMFEKPRWKLVIAIVMSATAIGIVYIISSRWSTAVEQFVLISFSSQIDSSFVSFDWISQTSSFDRSDDGYCLSRGRNHFFLLHFFKKMKVSFFFFLDGNVSDQTCSALWNRFRWEKKKPSMHLAEMFISWFLVEPWKAKSCFWLTPISTVRGRAVKIWVSREREHILYCV